MACIFITGSSDGIGQLTARALIARGHQVTLHARNPKRAEVAMAGAPGAEGVLIADLSSIPQTKQLASDANKTGFFDTVIHNAGIGYQEGYSKTEDGIAHVFAINALAPYILTSLMEKPKNLVYMSSGLHTGGDASLNDATWTSGRRWNGLQAYSDSKLFDVLLSFAVARHWPEVTSNAVSPGWVATKMGGSFASGSMRKGVDMTTWLAISDRKETGTWNYYAAQDQKTLHKSANNESIQEEFLRICEEISGVSFPKS